MYAQVPKYEVLKVYDPFFFLTSWDTAKKSAAKVVFFFDTRGKRSVKKFRV